MGGAIAQSGQRGGAVVQSGQQVGGAIAQSGQRVELLRNRVSGWRYCVIEHL